MSEMGIDPALAFALWGYDLRGDGILETAARIAEAGGGMADLNGPPLWDHPEWLHGWTRDGEAYMPPLHRALPYLSGVRWRRYSDPLTGDPK